FSGEDSAPQLVGDLLGKSLESDDWLRHASSVPDDRPSGRPRGPLYPNDLSHTVSHAEVDHRRVDDPHRPGDGGADPA
nr:hypothetical protein [Streptomyces sp. DSM 41633]